MWNLDKNSDLQDKRDNIHFFTKSSESMGYFHPIERGMNFFRGRNKWKVRVSGIFFPEVSLKEPPLTRNTNPPAHLATADSSLFSLSFSSRVFLPPTSPNPHPTPSFTSRTAGNWPKKTFAFVYKFLLYQGVFLDKVSYHFKGQDKWEPCKIWARGLSWPANINHSWILKE